LSAQVGLASLRAQTNDITSRNSGLTEQLESSREEVVKLTRVYNADIACRKTDQTACDKEVNDRFRDYQKTIENQKKAFDTRLEEIVAQQEQEKASEQAEHSEHIAASRLRHEKAIQSCRDAYNALQIIHNKKYSTHQQKISTQVAEHEQVVKELQDNYDRVQGYLEAAIKERDGLQVDLDAAHKEWDDCQDLWLEGFFERDRLQTELADAKRDNQTLYCKAQSELQDATSTSDRFQGELIDAEDETQRLKTQLHQRKGELDEVTSKDVRIQSELA
jgi:chromosome segregation ATPase